MQFHSDIADRVLALGFGADDIITLPFQITYPFEPRETLARIRAVGRRVSNAARPVSQGYQFEGWRLDLATRILLNGGNEQVRLTSREFEILNLLLRQANQPAPRNQIHVEHAAQGDSRAADAFVGRLRRKLVAAGARDGLIRPVR